MAFSIQPFDTIPIWSLQIFSIVSLICAVTDYFYNKIFNIITFSLLVFGLIMSLMQSNVSWWIPLLSIVFAFSIYLPLVILKLMGAGDAKLSMALASILGIRSTWELFFYSVLIASFGAFAILIRKKRVKLFFKEMKLMFQSIFYKGLSFHIPKLDRESKSPFGIAIFLSFMVIAGKRLYA